MPIVPWGQIVQEYIAEDRAVTQQTAIWPNGKPFTVSADDVRRLFIPSIPQPVVDCQQFQRLITIAVDQRLSRSEMEAFIDHAAKCSTCRYDYELESAAKTIVQTRLKMVKTPQALTESISRKISQADQDQDSPKEKKKARSKIFALPIIKPMFAVALVGVAILAIAFSPFGYGPTPAVPMGSDMLTQSLSNFHAVLAGLIQPQVVSDRPEQVREYLAGKTSFSAHVPALSNCTLVGASANEYHGMKLAHVMYKHDGQVIYIFQVPYNRVMAGDGLELSDEAKAQLANVGSFTNAAPGGDTVILWVLGNTLCAAVSRLDRKEMTRVLESSEDAPEKTTW
jgi:hypothetical protein